MRVRILDAAAQDLIDGFRFYEMQETGLGRNFINSLFDDIDSLSLYAGIHPVCFGTYHRLLAKRFPFAIYYRFDSEQVSVFAVLDCRRKPAWTRQRLGKS